MSHSAGRVALVTNATDFAGRPAVDALCDDGFRVYAHDRSFEDDSAWNDFAKAHPAAERAAGRAAEEAVGDVCVSAGALHVLVSNDHYPAIYSSIDNPPLDSLRASLEALVVEPYAAIGAAVPHMKTQGGGAIVMITSCRMRLPLPGGVIPDAARAATNAMARSLAVELAPVNIAVNAVAPNFLYSEAYYPKARFIDGAAGRDYIRTHVPAGRLAEPAEIGEVIRFLASAKTRFLTGALIDFAGGWPMGQSFPG